MKIINLEQFKTIDRVSLDGNIYEVYGRPVEDFLNDNLESKLDEAASPQQKFAELVEFACKYTNIPQEVLSKSNLGVLNAIIRIINGIDVEAELREQQEKEADQSGNA